MKHQLSCSACSSTEDLHLVLAGVGPGSEAHGKVLLYCAQCRTHETKAAEFDTSIPIAVVTPELFVRLYEIGRTSSSPETASEIVFGQVVPEAVEAAQAAIKKWEGKGSHG